MKRFYTIRLISFIIFTVLYLSSNISCSQQAQDIYSDSVSEMDYKYLNQELNMFNFPDFDKNNAEIKYKSVHNDSKTSPIRYHVYGMKIQEDFFPLLMDSLKKNKILINEPLSEHILFRFKLNDGKTFKISNLKTSVKAENESVFNSLNEANDMVNRINCFYYYQDLTVYKNPEKTRRVRKLGTLIFIDTESKMVIYYNDYISYK